MRWIIRLDESLAWLSKLCGWIACVAMILMAANVFYDVVARYAFNDVSHRHAGNGMAPLFSRLPAWHSLCPAH